MAEPILPYHLSQLATFCAAHPTRRKVVFVPSRQIGHSVGNALAAAGVSWVNLHLTTPVDEAARLVGPSLRASGWRPLVQDADLFFLQQRVQEIEWPHGHPFSTGYSPDGVARTFLTTMRALRSAGVDPDRMGSIQLRYGELLYDLYRSYVDWMNENRLFDGTLLLMEAAFAQEVATGGVFAIFDEVELSAPAVRFVKEVSDGKIARIGRASYEVALPPHAAGRRLREAPIVDDGAGHVHVFTRIAGPGLAEADAESVQLREAIGVENEIRGVLRELTAQGVRIDEVEIAYTSTAPYLTLLVDAADRLDLPLSAAEGIPITCTTAGQSLLGFYRWIAGGCHPGDLVRLCRGGLLRRRKSSDASPHDVARVIEKARVGRRNFETSIRRYEDRMADRRGNLDDETGRARIDRRIDRARRVRRFLRRLYSLVPEAGTTSVCDLCEAGTKFLDIFAPVRNDRDGRSGESLRDRLLELADSVDIDGRVSDISRMMAEVLSEHKVEASVARAGHLHAAPVSRAGYAGRRHVIVLGLAETYFPGVATEDPILLDDERSRLSAELRLERSRPALSGWHLLRALGMAAGPVMLTAHRKTMADARETYPCALFQQAADQIGIRPIPTYHPVPAADTALDESELALSLRSAAGMLDLLEARFPALADGVAADRERRSPTLSRYDGWLGSATPELRPGADQVLSASTVEDLAACPYRYFLKHVLHVRPPEIQDDVPGRWLTPLEFGSLLHAVLKEFMHVVTERGEQVDAARHAGLMEDVVQRLLDETADRIPPSYETGYRMDAGRLRRAARIFLNEESKRAVQAAGFEVSFGLGESDGLNQPEPVVIELSEGIRFRLRGSIDRVDCTPDGYEIWDYKSGSTFDYDEYDLLRGGRRLQWALYAHALESILEENGGAGPIRKSGYFFTSDREHGLRLGQAPPSKEELAAGLKPLFDLAAAGGFLHVQKSEACTYCDYREVCKSERRGKRDLDDIVESTPSDHPFLEPLERWMEV